MTLARVALDNTDAEQKNWNLLQQRNGFVNNMAGHRGGGVPRSPRLWSASLINMTDKGEQSQLLEAVLNNDYDSAVRLVTVEGVRPKCDNRGNTLVCVAAGEGRERILSLLLDHEGDPDEPDLTDYMWLRRPIHLAASHGHEACLRILLDKGVDVNCRDSDHRTPLHWAATYGQNEVAEVLITRGASVNMAQIDGFTPLHAATCLGHIDVCRTLIRHGADVNRADRDNWTALHTAACYGYKDVVSTVLDAGALLHQRTNDSETAFHVACSSGHLAIAELLYEHGSLINVVNINGYTPFHLAVYYNKFDIARFLITINADISTHSNAGQSPFYLAALRGEERMLRLMIEAGCKVTSQESAPVASGSHDLMEQLRYLAINPRSLKDLCCFKIRSVLSHTLLDDVLVLPIPDSLKDIIALKHI